MRCAIVYERTPFTSFDIATAISTANKPNKVENLIIGFNATEVVSLNGSPTVSPNYCRIMQWSIFFLQINFNNFLGVVPCSASISHVNSLE